MSYGLSVFWLPLTKAIPGAAPAECKDLNVWGALTTTTCNWRVSDLLVTFTIGIVVLGLSAALFGGWLERAGPRKAGLVAAVCWGGGFLGSALGVYLHQLWMIWLFLGLVGGVGLGLGYISPVSTLVKWFPDRRGMATGMAIMGFGGGAMIGSPLANMLMTHFKTADEVGAWQALAILGVGYFVFMCAGALGYRVSPEGWRPEGWTPPVDKAHAMITRDWVALNDAHKTPQFWLIWAVLCLNVSAGIGVLSMASPMLQEIFGGSLIGHPETGFSALDAAGKADIAKIAAGFVGLLSLFNIAGRFFWASTSDRDRPQGDLFRDLRARNHPLRRFPDTRPFRAKGAVRSGVLRDPVDVWRRLRHCARLPRRYFRRPLRWRYPRTSANGLVDRRRRRSVGDRLHPRRANRGGCRASAGV